MDFQKISGQKVAPILQRNQFGLEEKWELPEIHFQEKDKTKKRQWYFETTGEIYRS